MCILAVARGCPSTALTLTMHTNVLGSFVAGLGTPEQRASVFCRSRGIGQVVRIHNQRARGGPARERFVLSTTFTPQDDGGYRVSGHQAFLLPGRRRLIIFSCPAWWKEAVAVATISCRR